MKNVPSYIAGVDEAGRGPLAGPLTVAAVILDPNKPIAGLNDSKQLSQKKRELLFPQIQEYALAWHIEIISPAEIDQLNILQATLTGMRRAVCALSIPATVAHIDGNKIPQNMPCPSHALVGGDRIDQAIMAASILAKVHRDALMEKLHLDYPEYAFNQHKGYPTELHLNILKTLGPCPEHRRSYAPVKRFLNNELF